MDHTAWDLFCAQSFTHKCFARRSGLRSRAGTRSAQPEEGVEVTEPEDDGEAIEGDGSQRPPRPGAGWANGDRVRVPTEKRGAPPIPHEGHFRIARLRSLGVVEDALAVALQPPPGIVVDQLEPLSDGLRM